MCKIMEEYAEEYAEECVKEQVIKNIINAHDKGFSVDVICNFLDVSKDYVQSVLANRNE